MRQVEHGKNIGVGKFILERKTHYVEHPQRVLALQRIQRNIPLLHLLLHVHPGHEHTFTPDVVPFVEDLIQYFHAQKGHAHLVGIRKAESEPKVQLLLLLIYAARFAAGIAARFLHCGKRSFQLFIQAFKHPFPFRAYTPALFHHTPSSHFTFRLAFT